MPPIRTAILFSAGEQCLIHHTCKRRHVPNAETFQQAPHASSIHFARPLTAAMHGDSRPLIWTNQFRIVKYAQSRNHPRVFRKLKLREPVRANQWSERQMKFGIFYELQLPRPWKDGDEHKLYQNALSQVELADKLGYDYAWEVRASLSRGILTFAVAGIVPRGRGQRTKQIRLSHGIWVTTNHRPASLRRVACLDLLSSGRCEFGMGESASSADSSRSALQWRTSARSSKKPCRPSSRCSRMAVPSITANTSTCRCAMCCRSRCRSRTRRCGVACSQLNTLASVRRVGHGRARLPVRLGRRHFAWVHAYYNAFVKRQKKLADYVTNRISRWCRSSCANRRGGARAPTARPSSSSRCAITARRPAGSVAHPGTVNMWDEYNRVEESQRTRTPRRCAAA